MRPTTFALWLALPMCVPAAGQPTSPGAPAVATTATAPADGAARINLLVRDLGHASFEVRESAAAELVKIGRPALAALRTTAEGPEPEAAHRARQAIAVIDPLRVTLTPDKASYLVGEPIKIEYRVDNTGKSAAKLGWGGDYRGSGRHERFKIAVTDEAGREMPDAVMNPVNMGGIMGDKELAPGASFTHTIDLQKYRRVTEPGRYRVRIIHDLGLKNPPVGETAIALRLPDAKEARAFIEQTADLGRLGHPVYLPALVEKVDLGEVKYLTGIGSIRTLEASRTLVGFVARGLERDDLGLAMAAYGPMQDRLPNPRYAQTPDYYKANLELVRTTWSPDFAPTLRRLAGRLAHDPAPRDLYPLSFIYETVGVPEDLPDLIRGYDKAIKATETLPFETHQYFRPRGAAYSYRFSAIKLLERGATPPAAPQSAGEMAVYLLAMRTWPEFRPRDWPEHVVRFLRHETPYLREMVLDFMPEPAPPAALDMLPELLAHEYVDLAIAACHTAGKHPRPEFAEPIRKILVSQSEQYLLNAAAAAAPPNGVTKDRVMEVWVKRMVNEDLGGRAVVRLLLSVLDDNQSSSKAKPEPSELDAARERWSRFIEEHRAELRRGRTYKIGDAAITEDLFPPGFSWHHEGKQWPARR